MHEYNEQDLPKTKYNPKKIEGLKGYQENAPIHTKTYQRELNASN